MDLGDRVDQLVETAGSQLFQPGNPFGILADGLDHFGPRLPSGDQRRQQCRRMLQVAVHSDDRVALGVFHAAGQGGLETVVAGQNERPDAGILLGQAVENQRCRVLGPVVDINQFEPVGQRFQVPDHFAIKSVDVFLLVVDRHGDRNQFLFRFIHRYRLSPQFRRGSAGFRSGRNTTAPP